MFPERVTKIFPPRWCGRVAAQEFDEHSRWEIGGLVHAMGDLLGYLEICYAHLPIVQKADSAFLSPLQVGFPRKASQAEASGHYEAEYREWVFAVTFSRAIGRSGLGL